MLGTNAVAKAFPDAAGKLLVNDVFYTIQGEGPDAGLPAVFVRLAKCNLRCYFCDTEFEKGIPRTANDVAHQIRTMVKDNRCGLVVITGGEPLLQNIVPLVTMLNMVGLRVSVETAGTVCHPDLSRVFGRNRVNTLVCSPKTPQVNKDLVPLVGAWKYIISEGKTSGVDGLPNYSTQQHNQLALIFRPKKGYDCAPIYVQPMDEQDETRNKINLDVVGQIAMKFGYRVSIQTHKLLGVP